MLVRYGEHAPAPAGAPCEACGVTPPAAVTDHCHKHGWVRGILYVQCNANMALIDRGLLPRVQQAAALATFARRCPECPAVDVADLSPLVGRTAFTWRLTADQALTLDEMTLRLKRQLGRAKLDKAEMLALLVGLADEQPWVFDLLVSQMRDMPDDTRTRVRQPSAG